MRAIHKFPLAISGDQTVLMPDGAEILCVQMQLGVPCVWARVDTEHALMARTLRMYGTGHPLPSEHERYIGTFQCGERLVFHLFEC